MNSRFALKIGPGIVTDETVTAINAGSWADSNLVRFWRALPQTIKGWEANTTDSFSGICRGLFAWRDNAGLLNIAIGTHTGLYLWQDGEIFDITPEAENLLTEDGDILVTEDDEPFLLESTFTAGNADGYGGAGFGTGPYGGGDYGEPSTVDSFPLTWSFGSFGEWLVANPRGQAIYTWRNDTAEAAARLDNAPAAVTHIAVDGNRRQIIAYGCNEETSDTPNPRCIRWCDFEQPTVWETLPSNNAGEYILESAGRLVAARLPFVWTESELFYQAYLGDPGQTFLFQRQGVNCGLIGPNAAVVAGQTAYWITPAVEFMAAGLGAEPVGLQSPLRRELFDNLAPVQQEKIYAYTLSRYNEIGFCYPDARDGDGLECSREIVFSTVGNGWMKHSRNLTAYIDATAMEYPVGADTSGFLYWMEKGDNANGSAMNCWAQSGDIRISEGAVNMLVRGFWPDFDDQQGAVNLTVKTKAYPQDTYTTKGPYALSVGMPKKDFTAQGKFMAVRLESNAAPTFWRASPLNFEGTQRGRR